MSRLPFILISLAIIILFEGCGDDNKSDTSSVSSSSSESSLEASSSSESSLEASSSSESSSVSSFSNLGNSANFLGYYGENVYFGSEKIVGDWRLYDKTPSADFTFDANGMGNRAGLELSYGYELQYGVNEDGSVLYFVNTSTLDENNIVITYKCQRVDENCCLIETSESSLEQQFCKIDDTL